MKRNSANTHKPVLLFTGGGTAGHVIPNIALIQRFLSLDWNIFYIGSKKSVEQKILSHYPISYYSIQTGKLRRYFSVKNFIDPFKIIVGIFQAWFLLRKHRPCVLFSKGGFVAFPVVIAAWLWRIPVIVHESDFTPGLANKLSFPFAKTICVTFSEAKKNFQRQSKKLIVTGIPIRPELFVGDAARARKHCGFTDDKPIVLIIGGGQGAAVINQTIRNALTDLLTQYQIIHLCGQGKCDPAYENKKGYMQYEFAAETLADFFAAAELVVSRSGANTLYEILALKKPHILIPLSKKASRGDQIHNANYFKEKGMSTVIPEEDLSKDLLIQRINEVYANKDEICHKLDNLALPDSIEIISELIKKVAYGSQENSRIRGTDLG